jgi:hypothetical protein
LTHCGFSVFLKRHREGRVLSLITCNIWPETLIFRPTAPPYPYSLLPYIFIAYLALGCVWYGTISVNLPHALKGIHEDLEA